MEKMELTLQNTLGTEKLLPSPLPRVWDKPWFIPVYGLQPPQPSHSAQEKINWNFTAREAPHNQKVMGKDWRFWRIDSKAEGRIYSRFINVGMEDFIHESCKEKQRDMSRTSPRNAFLTWEICNLWRQDAKPSIPSKRSRHHSHPGLHPLQSQESWRQEKQDSPAGQPPNFCWILPSPAQEHRAAPPSGEVGLEGQVWTQI